MDFLSRSRQGSPEELRAFEVWNQHEVPVVFRSAVAGEKIRVRLPFHDDNRAWLRNRRRSKPVWMPVAKHWELPRSWFNDLVNRALGRFGKLYIIQPFREYEKCAPACQTALGHECQCSCMGANHGTGSDGSWFVVSDTFAIRWTPVSYACRLLIAKPGAQIPDRHRPDPPMRPRSSRNT